MKKHCIVLTVLYLGFAAVFISPARAEWMPNGTFVFGGADGVEMNLGSIAPDGGGGAIIAWGNSDYYYAGWSSNSLQNINLGGVLQWASPIHCDCDRWEFVPRIVPDGTGGVFYATSGMNAAGGMMLCAYRIFSGGTSTYITVSTYPWIDCLQQNPRIIPDGAGGAIIAWQEVRVTGDDNDIYSQRIGPGNTALWGSEGVAVCTATGHQFYPQLTSDGAGGAIITWEYNTNIYAQKVGGGGTVQWMADGVPVCTAADRQERVMSISDGVGGAIVVWQDMRSGNNDIYAQRFDATGAALWTANGVPVCTATGTQDYPALVPDDAGGAIVGWRDQRDGTYDVYAQRIDGSGSALWAANGIPISAGPGDQRSPRLISDYSHGAIFAWVDNSGGDFDVYVQRINEDGDEKWTPGGVPVCTEAGDQDAVIMTPSVPGGAIVAWLDYRTWSWGEIYAMLIHESLPPVATQLRSYHTDLVENAITVTWTLAQAGDGMAFFVYRAEGSEPFEEMAVHGIVRSDLSFSFRDESIESGRVYRYRIEVSDEDGRRLLFETDPITVPVLQAMLYQNHPNPFNPSTTIRYYLPDRRDVKLELFDTKGRRIALLVDAEQEQGFYTIEWHGKDREGNEMVSGVYFYRLIAGKEVISKKIVLLR